MVVLFLHGAGSGGAAAWPLQAAESRADWLFVPRAEGGDHALRDSGRLIEQLRTQAVGHVVAHSYGANAALLAAQTAPQLVRTLTLLEPACFDLARGKPAVEDHILAMAPVLAAADNPSTSAREFFRIFAEGMGFDPPPMSDEELEAKVRRLRTLPPPWGVGLQSTAPLTVPTLVITGGWSSLYEQTADALVDLGARHQVLEGAGHRVQDLSTASELFRHI